MDRDDYWFAIAKVYRLALDQVVTANHGDEASEFAEQALVKAREIERKYG